MKLQNITMIIIFQIEKVFRQDILNI
jgi:hypothetical protein